MKKLIKNQKSLLFILVLLLGVTACNKPEDIITENETTAETILIPVSEPVVNNSFVINNNLVDLNRRLTLVQEPIMFNNNLKSTQSDIFGNTWYFVAEVQAYIMDGKPLSATDVRILGDRAYVTYHRQGSEYAGAIEIIDISDPGFPVIRSYMTFTDTDINTLAIDDRGSDAGERKIWLAGSSFKKGAVLRQVIANNGYLTNDVVDIPLSKAFSDGRITANANGIGFTDQYIYMTSGNSVGGTFQLDKATLSIIAHEEYTDAKAIGVNGANNGAYQVSLVAGDDAKLKVHRVGTNRALENVWDLGSIVHQNVAEPYLGKATVTMRNGENIAYITMNQNGMKAIDVTNGNVVYNSPASMLTTGNTHGLTIDDQYIYMANSDDGLFIGRFPEGGGEIIPVQNWDLDETGASANMVQTDGDWIFVAKGGGGLKILRKIADADYPPAVCDWDEDGAPTCKNNPEVLCEDLVSDFNVLLPERVNAIVNHPELFDPGKRKELVLTETADVSVTFVSEGAGFTNSFGYYTYNENNPPQSVEDIQSSKQIIFANASSGSKGTLEEGDRMYLGAFEAGTVIGYFLIADGWNGSNVTEGLYTFYTNPALNRDGKQQSIMMFSERCSSLLTAFEDVHINGGDKDYNDIVIKTSVTPMSAMDTTDLVLLPAAK